MSKPTNLAVEEFPVINEMLNTENLKCEMQKGLDAKSGNDLRISRCSLEQLSYKPGHYCRMLFKTRLEKDDGTFGLQQYSGALKSDECPEDKQIFEWSEEAEHELVEPRHGPKVIFLLKWNLMLWAFPNDPNLPGMAYMETQESLLGQMNEHPEDFGLPENFQAASVSYKTKRYVPLMRFGALVTVKSNADEFSAPRQMYAKIYKEGSGARAFETVRRLWMTQPVQEKKMLTPEPYSFDAKHGILWSEAVIGKPLSKIANKLPDFPHYAGKIGKSLAAYHGSELKLSQSLPFPELVSELGAAFDAIVASFPEKRDNVARLRKLLLADPEKLQNGTTTPLHFSFKLSHVLLVGDDIVFIDFDGAKSGDPGYDIGRFSAHVYKMAIESKIDVVKANEAIRVFYEAYNQAAAKPLDYERIKWFTAFHLIASQAYKAVKRMNPKWLPQLFSTADEVGRQEAFAPVSGTASEAYRV